MLTATVYEHVRELMPDASEAKVRAVAGSLGFSADAADKAVEKLSGGEKARLLLGLATFGGPHLLILDEPTNHLDIDSRSALIEAINEYPGAVILVSHDRHLLDACADRLWLVAGGQVTPFDGDLGDYRRRVLSERERRRLASRGPSRANPIARTPRTARRVQSRSASVSPAPRPRSPASTREIEKLDAALADVCSRAIRQRPRRWPNDAPTHAAALAEAEEDWLAAGAALEAATG